MVSGVMPSSDVIDGDQPGERRGAGSVPKMGAEETRDAIQPPIAPFLPSATA